MDVLELLDDAHKKRGSAGCRKIVPSTQDAIHLIAIMLGRLEMMSFISRSQEKVTIDSFISICGKWTWFTIARPLLFISYAGFYKANRDPMESFVSLLMLLNTISIRCPRCRLGAFIQMPSPLLEKPNTSHRKRGISYI